MKGRVQISKPFSLESKERGRRQRRTDATANKRPGRVPRVAQVMALAIHCEQLIQRGLIKNQSELAHYAQISTGRMTQIMTLLNLAPEIQEAILELPLVETGRAPITEIEVRPIALQMDWAVQRGMWVETHRLRPKAY